MIKQNALFYAFNKFSNSNAQKVILKWNCYNSGFGLSETNRNLKLMEIGM